MKYRAYLFCILISKIRSAIAGGLEPGNCSCGYQDANGLIYAHTMQLDFSRFHNVEKMLLDENAANFTDYWMIYDYWQRSDNHNVRLDAKYGVENVRIRNGFLELTQKGYSDQEQKDFKPVRIAGVQTKATNIIHGTFRLQMMLDLRNQALDSAGTCASFFWYHDDRSELDMEIVTAKDSIVNGTINWTSQPSTLADGTRIPGATFSRNLLSIPDFTKSFQEYRFDCVAGKKVDYFLNGNLMHTERKNLPKEGAGGSLQLKLWSDGNHYWSGTPSQTDVRMKVKSFYAYYNTTDGRLPSICDDKGTERCDMHFYRPNTTSDLVDVSNPGNFRISATYSSVATRRLPLPWLRRWVGE